MCTVLNSLNAIQSIHKNEPHRRLHHSIYFCKSSSFIAFDPIFTEIHENAIPHVRRTNDIFSQTSEYAMSKVSNYVNATQSIHKNVPHQKLQHSIYLRKSSSFIAFDPIFTAIHENEIPHVRRTNDIFFSNLRIRYEHSIELCECYSINTQKCTPSEASA